MFQVRAMDAKRVFDALVARALRPMGRLARAAVAGACVVMDFLNGTNGFRTAGGHVFVRRAHVRAAVAGAAADYLHENQPGSDPGHQTADRLRQTGRCAALVLINSMQVMMIGSGLRLCTGEPAVLERAGTCNMANGWLAARGAAGQRTHFPNGYTTWCLLVSPRCSNMQLSSLVPLPPGPRCPRATGRRARRMCLQLSGRWWRRAGTRTPASDPPWRRCCRSCRSSEPRQVPFPLVVHQYPPMTCMFPRTVRLEAHAQARWPRLHPCPASCSRCAFPPWPWAPDFA